jgi:hypothetical protein
LPGLALSLSTLLITPTPYSVRILCLDFLPGLVFWVGICAVLLYTVSLLCSVLLCFIKQGSAHCVPFSSTSTNACASSPSRLSCTYTSINRASHFHSHSCSPFVAGLKLPSTTASSSSSSASPHSLHQRQRQAQRQAKAQAREPKQHNLEFHTSATYRLTTSRIHCNLEFDHLRLSSNNTTPTLPSCRFAFRLATHPSR